MKGRNAIFFSIAVVFCSWLALGVFVKALPLDGEGTPDYGPAPDPRIYDDYTYPDPNVVPDAGPEPAPDAGPEPAPDAGPEPAPDAVPEPGPAPDAGPEPEPAPDAGPEPAPDAGPEPAPDAGPEPAPDAGPEPVPEPVVPDEDVGGEEVVEEVDEPESESESDSDSDSDSDSIETKPEPEPYAWLEEWQKRIVELNMIVFRLQGENNKLQEEVYAYEKQLEAIQQLETSLSNEVNTWLKGMQFPGLAVVHDAIGITSDHIINSVGEEADGIS